MPPRGPRSVLWVVVVTIVRLADRARVQPRRDQTRDVRDVGEEQRADLVGDLAERREVDDARVRGGAALDQLGRCSRASRRSAS